MKAIVGIRNVCSYTMAPRLIKRAADLLPNLKMFAGLMAVILGNVRLLPVGHPFLNPSQFGKFGIREVMAAAAHNLKFEARNADQFIVYASFVIGIVLLLLQFAFLIAMTFTATAHAAVPFVGFFETVNPETDIAYLMLDRVFGIPDFFGSCYDPAVNLAESAGACKGYITAAAYPTPFQDAMQELFKFYSNGMLSVAFLIMLYYFFAMIVETSGSGRFFGGKFQSVYTPVRLVLAVLLMLPLAHGYNTGQYLVLNAAKWGSSFGTNAWLMFNEKVGDNPLGLEPQNLTGKPKSQDVSSLINFMYLVKACQAAYTIAYNGTIDIKPYFVLDASSTDPSSSVPMSGGSDYYTTLDFYKKDRIAITFGEKKSSYTDYPGLVKPYCGQLVMPVSSYDSPTIDQIYEVQFNFIRDLWDYDDLYTYGAKMAYIVKFWDKLGGDSLPSTTADWAADEERPAGAQFYIDIRLDRQADFNAQMDAVVDSIRTTANPDLDMDSLILDHGWGGAGMWFNKIASFNGSLIDAVYVTPTPVLYPFVMEFVQNKKKGLESNTPVSERFSPELGHKDGKPLSVGDFMQGVGMNDAATDLNIASLLNVVYKEIANSQSTSRPVSTTNTNPLMAIATFIMGDTGLFDNLGNDEVFPLARLAVLGRTIIDKTIAMIGGGTLMMGLGGFLGGLSPDLGNGLKTAGDSLFGISTLCLGVGLVLYYLIPFMPFIYFFLAVGRWVKSIFEAMVAVPLWALAHIRLSGEGVVGPAAAQGYMMLLEILLRPILTLFGLLAALTIFAAMATGLDMIWVAVVLNVGGFDLGNIDAFPASSTFIHAARGTVDELFYTLMYTVVVYMMAISSFKLINIIPDRAIAYLGFGGRAFADQVGDPMETLMQFTDDGANLVDQAKDGLKGIASEFGSLGGNAVKKATSTTAEKMRGAPK